MRTYLYVCVCGYEIVLRRLFVPIVGSNSRKPTAVPCTILSCDLCETLVLGGKAHAKEWEVIEASFIGLSSEKECKKINPSCIGGDWRGDTHSFSAFAAQWTGVCIGVTNLRSNPMVVWCCRTKDTRIGWHRDALTMTGGGLPLRNSTRFLCVYGHSWPFSCDWFSL